MQLIISGRNIDIDDGLRSHIEEQFERLSRYEPGASRAEITLREEKSGCTAEAVLSIDRRPPIHGQATADGYRTAIDRLQDKLARQLKKARGRRRDHKAPKLETLLDDDSGT